MSQSLLNQLQCATALKNTGFGTCVLQPGMIVGAFIVPNGYTLSEANLADIATAVAKLTSDAKLDSKLSRIYPIGNFEEPTPATEKKIMQTFKYGGKAVVREGDIDWSFQFVQGGLCLHSALRSFNSNGGFSVLFYDSNNVLYGVRTSANGLMGIPTKVMWTEPWDPNDGSAFAKYMIQFVFLPTYINDQLGYVQLDSTLPSVAGLQDVKLINTSWTESTGVAIMRAVTACGSVNMGAIYGTSLAVVGAWIARNAATGAVITTSTVTYSAVTGLFTVTIDTTDGDFPAGTQGILLDFPAVSALVGLSVSGFESTGPVTLATTA